jgi:thiamine biosynthesis lipoprotein
MRTAIGMLLAALCAAGAGCARVVHAERTVERSREAMGAPLRLTASTVDEAAAVAAFDGVFAEFDRLDALMSVWKPGSEIARLNESAGVRAVPIGADVRSVLLTAREVSDWTDGTFDVTFGALSGLWKFDHDQDDRLPDMDEVRRRLPLVDYRSLEIDERAGTAFLKHKGMRAHLGGIGKGYAIDRASAILRARGLHDFMIQAGGDLYVAGRNAGRPWRVGIQDPRGPADRVFATLDLSDGTFSTSGDYERFFMKDGRRYHHIIDPRTGEPSQSGCRSVTIVTDRAVVADGLSTGVFLLGPQKGIELLQRLEGVEAVIVTSANEVLITPGLQGRVTLARQPTDSP